MRRNAHNGTRVHASVFGICIIVLIFSAERSSGQRNQNAAASQHEDDATISESSAASQSSRKQTLAERLNELTEQSRNDLAPRLNIDASAITVIEARYVVWPDSSAGCPMPGYEYMQMLTEGVLIRLGAGDRTYHYHSARGGAAFLCEKPSVLEPPSRFEER